MSTTAWFGTLSSSATGLPSASRDVRQHAAIAVYAEVQHHEALHAARSRLARITLVLLQTPHQRGLL